MIPTVSVLSSLSLEMNSLGCVCERERMQRGEPWVWWWGSLEMVNRIIKI